MPVNIEQIKELLLQAKQVKAKQITVHEYNYPVKHLNALLKTLTDHEEIFAVMEKCFVLAINWNNGVMKFYGTKEVIK